MKVIKSRAFAIIAMCLLLLLSIPVGSCVSLSRERGEAEKYYYGSDSDFDYVWGLVEDIRWCSSSAANLVTLANRILPADSAAVTDVMRAREALDNAVSPAEKCAALSQLTERFSVLYRTLCAMDLNEEDLDYCRDTMSDYNSDLDFISRNEYNTKAKQFNDALANSPGGAIASAFGVKPLELFQSGNTYSLSEAGPLSEAGLVEDSEFAAVPDLSEAPEEDVIGSVTFYGEDGETAIITEGAEVTVAIEEAEVIEIAP